jgi:hypothetical protein
LINERAAELGLGAPESGGVESRLSDLIAMTEDPALYPAGFKREEKAELD